MHIVSQAPQHSKYCETQAACGGCFCPAVLGLAQQTISPVDLRLRQVLVSSTQMAQKNQVRAKIANEELYKLSKNQMSKVDLCCKLHEAQHCSIVKYHLQQNNGSMHILQKSVAI